MRKIRITLSVLAFMSLIGCGTVSEVKPDAAEMETNADKNMPQDTTQDADKTDADAKKDTAEHTENTEAVSADVSKKAVVVYYSRADDNYSVGTLTVGNTAKVAAEIVRQTGADSFEITPVKPYPKEYTPCTELAKQELADRARPQIATTLENFDQYDTVYLGYPIWWGDMPMIVYTFIENYNFDQKTVITFNTHEGSGNSGTTEKIRKALPKANVRQGLVMTGGKAQNDADEVTKQVKAMLNVE